MNLSVMDVEGRQIHINSFTYDKIPESFDEVQIIPNPPPQCHFNIYLCQFIQKKQEEKKIKEDQAANARYWKIPACCDDDDDYNFAITPNEPVDSLSMGDEHLNTIPATKSNEFIKSSVENLVSNPKFVSENSNAEIESFSPSPIPVKDSDSFMEETDLTFTPDDPVPPGIEEDDYDSERDILIYEELLDNHSLSLPVIESYHFDIPSFSRPPAKPPDDNTGILNVKMMGDIFEQKVPMPKLMITLASNQEKSPGLLSHQGLQAFLHSATYPMMIHGKNIPILDVPIFHFYPLDQFKYEGIGLSSTT
nr:hypothetical protein [Tanacetum cinerariifolium]